MGKIHVHEFITADGVIDTPAWTMPYGFDERMGERIGALTSQARGILLGRVTYEMFAPAWSTRTVDDDPGAPFFNDTHKYVVSSTLSDPTWGPATVMPYDPAQIRALKDNVGDLYISGSGTLVRALLEDGLVDELHLCSYPLTRGTGPKLFGDGAAPRAMELAVAESYDNGVMYLNYVLTSSPTA